MREIKFRALHEGEWYYQTLEEIITITLAAFRNGKYKTQFTGLYDKNKTPIYEGDIVKRFTGYTFEASFKLYSIGKGTSAYGYEHHILDEVVGNIYQNPELLKSLST
jgi:hypothetical protein